MPAVLGKYLATSTAGDERHLRAWGRLVRSICNEASASDAARARPLAPPGVAALGTPEKLSYHRQTRAHEAALERLANAMVPSAGGGGGVAGGVAGVLMEEEGHVVMALDDIEELDGLVQSSLREREEELQVALSDAVLQRMVGEVATELAAIGERRA